MKSTANNNKASIEINEFSKEVVSDREIMNVNFFDHTGSECDAIIQVEQIVNFIERNSLNEYISDFGTGETHIIDAGCWFDDNQEEALKQYIAEMLSRATMDAILAPRTLRANQNVQKQLQIAC